MIISEQWLREWVSPNLDTQALAHQITMAGLEVDAVQAVAGSFSDVVVGEIISAEQHPDADKLRVCTVNIGSDTAQIVCGAPNARVGLKAPLARIGAVLPGDFKIKKAKLRGVESQGMLCAEQELGLSESNEGLMELAADAPVGADLRDYLGLDDYTIEIGLTPNRSDCLGMRGIAREVGLLNEQAVTEPVFAEVPPSIEDTFPMQVEDAARCPRITGRIIRGIDPSRPSPLWLREKLRRAGLRPIEAVVDVTNYVMLELGQPMHAFDLKKLQGGITVRTARAGEKIKLLDGQTIEPDTETLLIADDSGPVGIAGIMGGASTAVSATTQNLFLEVAFFAPILMAGKARAYGLHTDASHRFERGVDWAGQRRALERATQLLLDIVGGEAGPVVEEASESNLPRRAAVNLRRARIEKLLGLQIPDAEVERILTGLGLGVQAEKEGWRCSVPSWRFDIAVEADLLEELARVYGYHQLPAAKIRADLDIRPRRETQLSTRALRRQLVGRGYREAITYSFVNPQLQQQFDPQLEAVALSNPISADMAVMRTSLIPGLLQAAAHNTARQQSRLRFFETGLRFLPESSGLQQEPTLALVCLGSRSVKSWSSTEESVDFFDLKGDIESILALTGSAAEFEFSEGSRPGLHPGQTACLTRKGQLLGHLGAVHPTLSQSLGFKGPVFVAELALQALRECALPAFTQLSKFPEIRRDLSFIVDKSLPVATLMEAVKSAAGTYLRDLTLFDVYTGKGIDPKRKSLTLGLTFRDLSRTLADDDVDKAMGQVIDLLEKNYKAELRA